MPADSSNAFQYINGVKQALPSMTSEPSNPYYIIHYGCSGIGQVRSIVAKWSIFDKGFIVMRSTPQKYQYEGDNITLPPTPGPGFLAKELKTYSLGLLMIPFRLVAVYSKKLSDVTVQCQLDAVEFLKDTMAMAPTFLEPMVEDGLLEHRLWNGDIQKLALKILPVTHLYFKDRYALRTTS
ncbi:hypothetical protein FQN50_007293 [Emmonsiellopsis sp. PD_5]|nr:hypothetical protein FQN50_007293 [Emmonsiellopsis sp. PD_5]